MITDNSKEVASKESAAVKERCKDYDEGQRGMIIDIAIGLMTGPQKLNPNSALILAADYYDRVCLFAETGE